MFGAYANLNDLVDFSEGPGQGIVQPHGSDPQIGQPIPRRIRSCRCISPMRRRSTTAGQHEKALEHYIIGGKMKRA